MPDVIATAKAGFPPSITAHAAASVEAGAPRSSVMHMIVQAAACTQKVLSKPPRGFRTVCARRDGVRVGVCRSWWTVQVCAPQSVSQSPDPSSSPEVQRYASGVPGLVKHMYALTGGYVWFRRRMCGSCVCLGDREKVELSAVIAARADADRCEETCTGHISARAPVHQCGFVARGAAEV